MNNNQEAIQLTEGLEHRIMWAQTASDVKRAVAHDDETAPSAPAAFNAAGRLKLVIEKDLSTRPNTGGHYPAGAKRSPTEVICFFDCDSLGG
jgi:hypothetical protein